MGRAITKMAQAGFPASRFTVVRTESAEQLVRRYVEGWCEGDAAKILDAVAPDCVVIESHGPTYRGKERIAQWLEAWFGAGGKVHRWEITSLELLGEAGCFEWSFACTWTGKRYDFEGASIIRFEDGKIAYLREYTTTAPLYDWEGSWR
jgi:ketosteroid isomerase-like protein